MKEMVKGNIKDICFISKDNIITEVSKDFLKLTGYTKVELVGKNLVVASKLLKIDCQIILEDMKEERDLFIFSNEGLAIDVSIRCEFSSEKNIRCYYFKENLQIFLRNILLNLDDLSISNKQALAVYSYPDCICLKTNGKYINSLNAIDPTFDNPIDKPYPYPKYTSRLMEEGSFYEGEVEYISWDGIETYWDMSMRLICGDEKKKYLILSLFDVTNRVIERKLQDKKSIEMELVLKNISDVIIIVNNKGDFIYKNKAGLDKFSPYSSDAKSLKLKELFGFFVFKDIDGNELSYEETPVQRVLRGEHINKEILVDSSQLPTSYHECTGIPIYDDLGNIDGGILTYRDIGDRIEAEKERALKKEQEFQRERLEDKLLKVGKRRMNKTIEAKELEFIRCTYPDLDIISINGNAINSIKKIKDGINSIDSLVGEKFDIIYPIYEVKKIKEWKYFLIEKENYSHVDYSDHIINEEQRFFKTIMQPMFGSNNKIVEVIFVSTDITDEIEAKNKMEETLEMQNQMFSTVSHELKTPLSVIFSASQLIEMYLKDKKNKTIKESISKSIDIIKQNCYRFTKLINNIIDLSSIESGFYKLNYSKRNIIETVENIVDSLRTYVENKGLSIIFDTEIEEKIIALDVDKIERIVLNLVSNAVKHSDKGDRIYVSINDKVDFIEILVRDCGIGIDKIHLNTIFDKYKRVDNSLSRSAEGSGIGLALVKTMVELMGGEISVESELGKGSLFTVRLPVEAIDGSEITNTIKHSNSMIEKINIELSDVYTK